MKLTRKLVLASASPRRRQLLESLGLEFEVRPTDVPEVLPKGYTALKSALYLAELKATAAQETAARDEVVLTSDTVVLLDEDLLGKPTDASEAVDMLKRLSGRTHTVVTAVALDWIDEVGKRQHYAFDEQSRVTLAELSDQEIAFYTSTDAPLDKAGAYGIQDWIGWARIASIEGSYPNVMGLPTRAVYEALVKHDLLRITPRP